MDVSAHLDLLGRRVADRVTGIEGVVTSVSYDLYGCVQALVVPPASADKARVEWYDVGRLKTLRGRRAMPLPDFTANYIVAAAKGPALKPPQERNR